MEPSVLWKEEIFGGFKYLPWVFFFSCKELQSLEHFLHCIEGWEVINSRDSWVFLFPSGLDGVCFVVWSIPRSSRKTCAVGHLFSVVLEHIWKSSLLGCFCISLYLVCAFGLTWSSLVDPAVACEARGRSHIQSAVGYFLPEGEVIPLPYQWYYKSRLHIPHALILYLYLLNVTAYKYPGNILSNPYPATENTNTEDCRETQTLQSFFHICLSNGPGVHLMPCIRAHL